MIEQFLTSLSQKPIDALRAAVDIGLVAYVLYRLFILIRGTRAIPLINGIIILVIAKSFAKDISMVTLNWLLDKAILGESVAIPIVFQPELRRALEQLGRGRLLRTFQLTDMGEEELQRAIEQIARACEGLSRTRTGALIVIERVTGLSDIIESGIRLESLVSAELLTNIFVENTPLHDGAIIIRGNRIMAAACFLPLAEATEVSQELGSRHRAAIGVTEHSDALVVVVSEETGTISVASSGQLTRFLDGKTLREIMKAQLEPAKPGQRHLWHWGTN